MSTDMISDSQIYPFLQQCSAILTANTGYQLRVGFMKIPSRYVIQEVFSLFQTTDEQQRITRQIEVIVKGTSEDTQQSNLTCLNLIIDYILRTKCTPDKWRNEEMNINRYKSELFNRLHSNTFPSCSQQCLNNCVDPIIRFRCWWNHLLHAYLSFHETGSYNQYRCPIGYDWLVTSVRIGQNPIASLYIGPLSYKSKSTILPEMTIQEDDVTIVSTRNKKNILTMMTAVSGWLSQFLTIIATQSIHRNISLTNNISEGIGKTIDPIWDHIQQFCTIDGGSIWIRWHKNPKRVNPITAIGDVLRTDLIDATDFFPGYFTAPMDERQITSYYTIHDISAVNNMTNAFKQYLAHSNMRSFAWIPMYWNSKESTGIFGVIELASRRIGAFSEGDKAFFEQIAQQVMQALRANMIVLALRKIVQAVNFKELTELIVKYIPTIVDGYSASLFMRKQPGEGKAYLIASNEDGINEGLLNDPNEFLRQITFDEEHESIASYEEGEGLTGWVLQSGRILNVKVSSTVGRDQFVEEMNRRIEEENEHNDLNTPLIRQWLGKRLGGTDKSEYCYKAWLGVPIVISKGNENRKTWGVLRVGEKLQGNFTEDDVNLIADCAKILADRLLFEIERTKHHVLLNQTIETLANAIDAKHEYTNRHSSEVSKWSGWIFDEMPEYLTRGMSRSHLVIAAMLHDIGKIRIPDILLSNDSPYYDNWMIQAMHEHPKYGEIILEHLDFEGMDIVRQAIRQHHEWCNGKGYPTGMTGEYISLYAKIIAVADSFNAIVSRSYQKGMKRTEREALDDITNCCDRYDPNVLTAFMKALDQHSK